MMRAMVPVCQQALELVDIVFKVVPPEKVAHGLEGGESKIFQALQTPRPVASNGSQAYLKVMEVEEDSYR